MANQDVAGLGGISVQWGLSWTGSSTLVCARGSK